jgi:hypothetical protein
MTPQIKTYDDLLNEKQRLEQLLKSQKEIIRQDIQEIKEEFKPVKHAFSFISKLGTKDKSNPLLTATTDTVINLLVKKLLLAKTGWVTRLIVPFILKNFSSHVVSENKGSIMKKIFSIFGKRNQNGKASAQEYSKTT